jgi:hypothetical protein
LPGGLDQLGPAAVDLLGRVPRVGHLARVGLVRLVSEAFVHP